MEERTIRKNSTTLTGAVLINVMSIILAIYLFSLGGFFTLKNLDKRLLSYALLIFPAILTVRAMAKYRITEQYIEERSVLGRLVRKVDLTDKMQIGTFFVFVETAKSGRFSEYIYLSKSELTRCAANSLTPQSKSVDVLPYDDALWTILCQLYPKKIMQREEPDLEML